VRMFIDIRCHKSKRRENRAYFTPSRRSVQENGGQEYRVPVASTSTRTSTLGARPRQAPCAKAIPTSSDRRYRSRKRLYGVPVLNAKWTRAFLASSNYSLGTGADKASAGQAQIGIVNQAQH